MAWATVSEKKERKPSLSAWLREQGFLDEVTDAVQRGKLLQVDIDRLARLRKQARGDGGKLSRVQCRSLQPAQVKFRGGKLLNLVIDGALGGASKGGQQKVQFADAQKAEDKELASLKREIGELRALLGQQPGSQTSPEQPERVSTPLPAGSKWKTCHVCGSREHLQAACPGAQEIRRVQAWMDVLQGESCLLPLEVRAQQMQEATARLERAKADAAEAKERSVLPEQLLISKRAEVKKRGDALAAARRKQEEHEDLLAQLQEEGEELRAAVAEAAEAFKQAEAALEAAERRVVRTIQPETKAADLEMAAESTPAPALSSEGAAALEGLVMQIADLAKPATIQDAENRHQEAVAAAELAGQAPPSILEFVLKTLSQEGGRKLELIRFDISKAVREPSDAAGASASPRPAAEPVRTRAAAIMTRPERPRDEGGLGDNQRLPQRVLKPLPRECARDNVEAMAAARRAVARERLRGPPVLDPLWAAIRTETAAAHGAVAPSPSAPAAPTNAEDAMAMGLTGRSSTASQP